MRIQIIDAGCLPGEQVQVDFEDIPLPEGYFRKLGIASRATFYRWEQEGLRVLKVGGRRFIYPADLKVFMESRDRKKRSGKMAG